MNIYVIDDTMGNSFEGTIFTVFRTHKRFRSIMIMCEQTGQDMHLTSLKSFVLNFNFWSIYKFFMLLKI